jgi:hypothetical protein
MRWTAVNFVAMRAIVLRMNKVKADQFVLHGDQNLMDLTFRFNCKARTRLGSDHYGL